MNLAKTQRVYNVCEVCPHMASAQEQPLEFTQRCVFTLRQSVGPVKHLEIACVFNCFTLYRNLILATAEQKYLTLYL